MTVAPQDPGRFGETPIVMRRGDVPLGSGTEHHLDLSDEVMFLLDTTGHLRWWNRKFEEVLGYPASYLAGRSVHELLYRAKDRDGAEPDSSFTEPGPKELRVVSAQGEIRTLEVRSKAVGDRVYVIGQDLTTRRAASDTEAQIAAIVENSPALISLKDPLGRFVIANRELRRLAGTQEVVGRSASELMSEPLALLGASDSSLLGEEGARERVVEEISAGGRVFLVAKSLVEDHDGGPPSILSIATDITQRRRAEERLRENERLFDTILKASPDIISMVDETGQIHRISEAEWSVLGHRHLEPPDNGDIFALVHPDDLSVVMDAFTPLFRGETAQIQVRYRVRHGTGGYVMADTRARAVHDDEGRFAGAVLVTRDVSASLEMQRRLREAVAAAQKASSAKSEFLSRMSHELRTPLNSILGFSQLLGMDELPDQQADAVRHILEAGRHLLDLIDKVLEIARIETGHLDLDLEEVMVHEVLSEAVEATAELAETNGVEIEVELDPELVVHVDSARLFKVLCILLSNGVQYNRPGGKVTVSSEPGEPGTVRLAVRDTGWGIKAEDISRVFEPFDRLGAEQTGVEGAGVGLAVARHLVEYMGGRLRVESVPGIGSTFWVELPKSGQLPLVHQ